MNAENRLTPSERWLDAKKKLFPRHVQGGRLDRFVTAVSTNVTFQTICKSFLSKIQQSDVVDEADDGPELGEKVYFLLQAARMGCCATLKETDDINSIVANSPRAGAKAVHIAVENGNCADVELLLELGAKIRVNERGLTPLHSASASTEPNPEIARLLIKSYTKFAVNRKIPEIRSNESTRGNTALHFAADNEQISREFIQTLGDIDPTIKNTAGETAFHVAAKAENQDVIVWMLEVFKPVNNGWKMGDIETDSGPKLLEICANKGNAKAVAFLIKYGACMPKQILFQLIDESVKNPTLKTAELIGVYRTITENCVLWDWLKQNPEKREYRYPRLGTEPKKHRGKQREVMLGLLTTRNKEYENRNVLEYAIVKGDKVFLDEIVNTPDVFKLTTNSDGGNDGDTDGNKYDAKYDVSNFIPSSSDYRIISEIMCGKSSARVEPEGQNPIKEKSYLALITEQQNGHLWENKDILQLEPFYTITQPICWFMQIIYFLMGVIQLVHMIVFSIYYMPPYFSLKNRLNLQAQFNSSVIPPDPTIVNIPGIYAAVNAAWLIWPTAVFFGTLCIRYGRHIKFRDNLYALITP